MKKGVYILILMMTSLTLSACSYSSDGQLSKEEKVADFKYMYKVVKEGYPYLDVNKRLNNIDWLENKNEYLKRIKNTKNDSEFKVEMENIISDLNNDHTELIDSSFKYNELKNTYVPYGWYDFFDDDIVNKRYNNLTYSQLSSQGNPVGELTVKDVVDNEVGYIYLPNMSSNENDLKTVVEYIKTLKNHKALIIDIRGNRGGNDAFWKNIVNRLIKEDVKTKGYMFFRSENEVIKNYINIRGISLEPIENLPQEIKNKAPKEVSEKFSGFSSSVENVIEPYRISPYESINFEGNIYLLVDEAVFSSAESFAIFCKDSNFATIIGQTTAGDGGGCDPVLFDLKNSGFIVRMSSDMYLTEEGICNEEFKTTPDYIIEDSKRDLNFDKDDCVQKALELEGIR